MNWCILIPLLVGLICALLGYLLRKFSSKDNQESCNCKELNARIATLEAELDACKKSKVSAVATATATATVFNAASAKAVFGKKIKEDDLTVVEGIGPKIKELFHNHNIKTWQALGNTSVEKCQEVLDSGGERFKVHKPGTWPKQAELASKGKWEELLKWQDELDGGKLPS
ncbi:hypothetical protein [uncultured Polaribacter sp.]|uniref:hypothetical protein n=1 Tax=uncultured Polaribacter sp. TaxID=174711 RepID=UPI0026260631|nr:hypothetical protein [uncultured Polaribacter sp.]